MIAAAALQIHDVPFLLSLPCFGYFISPPLTLWADERVDDDETGLLRAMSF